MSFISKFIANKIIHAKNKREWAISIAIHAILVLLFWLFGFDIIDPKPGDIEVAFAADGIENAGGETLEETTSPNPNNTDQEPKETESASANQPNENEYATDQTSETAIKNNPVKEKTKTTPKEVTTAKNPNETDSQSEKDTDKKVVDDDLQNLLGGYKNGPKNNGGKGSGDKQGTEGEPGGTGTDPNGGGGGTGTKYTVGNRKAVDIGNHRNDCGKRGTIYVWIKIDRAGNVISSEARGGTTQNECLIKQALQDAKEIKYMPSKTINEGRIEIKYSLN